MTSLCSCGGNILINVGPASDGMIAPVFEERLRQLGSWLGVNGEAIYASKPWKYQNDTVTPNLWLVLNAAQSVINVASTFENSRSIYNNCTICVMCFTTSDIRRGYVVVLVCCTYLLAGELSMEIYL